MSETPSDEDAGLDVDMDATPPTPSESRGPARLRPGVVAVVNLLVLAILVGVSYVGVVRGIPPVATVGNDVLAPPLSAFKPWLRNVLAFTILGLLAYVALTLPLALGHALHRALRGAARYAGGEG